MLGNSGGIMKYGWPDYREELAAEEEYEIVVQINGKVRAKLTVADGQGEEELRQRVMADPHVATLIAGNRRRK